MAFIEGEIITKRTNMFLLQFMGMKLIEQPEPTNGHISTTLNLSSNDISAVLSNYGRQY